MVHVFIKTESHFPINRKQIEAAVTSYLDGKVKRDAEVSIAVVGSRAMRQINRTYRQLDKVSDVLSFPFNESKSLAQFIEPPDNILRLGEIIVCYPAAVDQAAETNQLVDDVVRFLVLHGMDHLLGIHHPE